MAKQLITIGTPGAGGGEPAHAAFKKINDNTNDVYSFLGADGSGVLTAEGAREALNTYSKGEVENLVGNSGFASLETNTFTGLQKMQGGAEVSGNFKVNGIAPFGVGHRYQSSSALGGRHKDTTYKNTSGSLLHIAVQQDRTDGAGLSATVDNQYITDTADRAYAFMHFFVPPEAEYKVSGTGIILRWFEFTIA